ncbi:MAG: YIP1 family protein [Candidatus Scalindua sp.]
MGNFISRIIRAAKLEAHLYEEVEADKTAMRQAMLVVVLSGVAAGLGNVAKGGLPGILLGTVAALIGWYIWAFLIYLIGTKLLPEPNTRSDIGELLRTIGFSSSPGLIRVLGVIPGLEGGVFFMVATVWMLVAMVVAVRQALDYTGTMRAIAVCIIGWIVQILIIMLLLSLFGGLPKPT